MRGWLRALWWWMRRSRRPVAGPRDSEGGYEASLGQPALANNVDEGGCGGGCGGDGLAGLAEQVRQLSERVAAVEAAYGVGQGGSEAQLVEAVSEWRENPDTDALTKSRAAEADRTAEEVTRPGVPQGLRGQRARLLTADEIWEGVL
ncbi:MAG: hypothetical protein HPY69_06095 [Armatimonadetes bacterium]|nr:hypothetical protein [Armatimonadota bacterium]